MRFQGKLLPPKLESLTGRYKEASLWHPSPCPGLFQVWSQWQILEVNHAFVSTFTLKTLIKLCWQSCDEILGSGKCWAGFESPVVWAQGNSSVYVGGQDSYQFSLASTSLSSIWGHVCFGQSCEFYNCPRSLSWSSWLAIEKNRLSG